jgi:hypothetical protein
MRISPEVAAAAEQALVPFHSAVNDAECDHVVADWTSARDVVESPRMRAVDDARAMATDTAGALRLPPSPPDVRVTAVSLDLRGMTVPIRPERDAVRGLLEIAYVMDGWDGVDEVLIAADAHVRW